MNASIKKLIVKKKIQRSKDPGSLLSNARRLPHHTTPPLYLEQRWGEEGMLSPGTSARAPPPLLAKVDDSVPRAAREGKEDAEPVRGRDL